MDFVKIKPEDFETLAELQKAYKAEIGEAEPADAELESLKQAIGAGRIQFYGCLCGGALVACCSVCETYSTFHYGRSGVLEDFYIRPAYRHKGIARKLVAFAYAQSGAGSLTVGCADCDLPMYRAIGFKMPLGNLLAYGE